MNEEVKYQRIIELLYKGQWNFSEDIQQSS